MDTVQKWMNTPAIVIPETMTLPEARKLMLERTVRRLPVVDGLGRICGIVTEGDVNRISDSPATDVREYSIYYRVRDLPVREFMSRNVITVHPETHVVEVARLFFVNRIGGIPVVEGDEVVGMITESDLFRRVIEKEKDEADLNEQEVPSD